VSARTPISLGQTFPCHLPLPLAINDNYKGCEKGKGPAKAMHVVGPIVMVWQDCWCEDTRRALVNYIGSKSGPLTLRLGIFC
jgi:hypothetical protein